ncbi:hypothetical protein JZU46_03000 [bacterium]|nr:hypothetical protein [bacterium]
MLKVFLTVLTILILSSNAYAATKINFTYVGGSIDAKHLADISSYWVIVNKEKVGTINTTGDTITLTLKEGDKLNIGVNIKGASGALLGPTYIVGNLTQDPGAVAVPIVTALVLDNLTIQAPLFFKIN